MIPAKTLTNLPLELLETVASLLDTKSFLTFTKVSKKTKKLDISLIWKRKCFIEYNFSSHRIKNWKEQYKKLYLRLCVECHKKTRLYNEFYDCKVCRKCEIKYEKYHMITTTRAVKSYLLKQDDLDKLRYIERMNPYNSSQTMKLYLKCEILNYIKNQQSGAIKQRIDKRTILNISKLYKFNLYNSLLVTEYNVTPDALAYIFLNINMYTPLYQKYLRYSNRPVIPIIHKGLELAFISTYTRLNWSVFPSFPYLLKYFLLLDTTSQIIPFSINPYIDHCIKECIKNNKEQYIRKMEIQKLNYNLKTSSKITINVFKIQCVIDYIYYGPRINVIARARRSIENKYNIEEFLLDEKDVLKQIRKIIILYDFLYKYTDISNIILSSMLRNTVINSFRTYKIVLYNWYKNNPNLRYLMPYELYEFLVGVAY